MINLSIFLSYFNLRTKDKIFSNNKIKHNTILFIAKQFVDNKIFINIKKIIQKSNKNIYSVTYNAILDFY